MASANSARGASSLIGLIAGRVVPVPERALDGITQKIPHIGWNGLVPGAAATPWGGTLLDGIEAGESVYFVHSFMAQPSDPAHRLADCLYGGVPVSAAIRRHNVMGCQFHPEKSGEVGLRVLKNFLRP